MIAARQIFLGRGGGAKLPYDADVEYLESTGTQYILSQYKIIAGNIFELDISFVEDSSLGNSSVMVGRNASNNECFIRKNGSGYFGGGSFSSQFSIEYNTRYKMRFDLTAGAMSFTVDDTLLKSSSSTQPDRKQFPLFAVAAAAQNNINQIRKARIYSFKSWSGGELVEDWVSVRFTNELGQSEGAMYDRVSGELFRNAGTGAFLYGRDINPISARSYVNDGLIAMWDGIENAGWGIHDANATVWKDLVGTQDMALSQYGSFSDDSLVCAGTGYAASRGTVFDDFIYAETVVEYDSLERQNGNIVIWGEYSGMSGYHSSMDMIIYNDTLVQTGGQSVFYTKSNDKLFLLQYTRPNSDNVFALANGISLERYARQDNWATRYGIGFFGGRQSGYSYRGKIKRVAMYSRIPTAAEIAANYAIDKQRFNLP